MTNHWIDLKNADVILIMGSNAAENHPISFKWVMEAKDKGAKLIHVDPRYTKTSKMADVYASLRSGSDIPFLGGMINYILQKDLIQKDYVRLYTNASFIVNKDFKMPGELDGVFSGYDAKARKYDKAAWAFEIGADGVIKKDPTFKDPMCVLQLLKKHYSRYDLDTVSSITGTPKADLLKVYETVRLDARAGQGRHLDVRDGLDPAHGRHAEHHRDVDHPAAARQHGHGRRRHQRAARREQRPGLDRLRPALPHPAELPAGSRSPRRTRSRPTSRAYAAEIKEPQSANWPSNSNKYFVSYLKAIFGDNATPENEFGYQWLPKLDDGQNASWLVLFDEMLKGKYKGFFAWGQNPACSSSNAGKVRKALAKLEWMVNVNLFDNETASFWRGPGMNAGGDQDRGLHAALRLLGREGGEHLELGPLGPVALQGGRAPRARRGRTARSSTSWRSRSASCTRRRAGPSRTRSSRRPGTTARSSTRTPWPARSTATGSPTRRSSTRRPRP